MLSLEVFLSGIVIFITHTIEAITGFGCAALAMPFVTSLLGMQQGVMVVTVIAWLLALYVCIRNLRDIAWRKFVFIFISVLCGLPIGMYIFQNFDSNVLKKILAVFIIIVSAIQLIKTVTIKNEEIKDEEFGKVSYVIYFLLLFLGGVVHGLFSSGGPLIVLYAKKALTDKRQFRATLCLLWSLLNSIIIISYFFPSSGYTRETFDVTLIMLPFLLAGIIFGEKILNKVNARIFSLIVFVTLFLSGIFMLFT